MIDIENASSQKWAVNGTCSSMGPAGTLASCKIQSISVGGVDVSDAVAKNMGGMISISRQPAGQTQQFFTSATSNQVVVVFQSGAFTAPATAGSNYTAAVYYNGGSAPSITGAPVTVAAVNQTVTFDANGGTGSIAQQTASAQTNLTPNNGQITRSGYSFGGWASSAGSSTVAFADGAPYPFTSSTTLYAIWNANGGGGGSSSSSAATLTLDLAVGQPVAGAPVNLNVTGMQANAAWDATVRSTPQSIGSGNVNSSGALTQTVNLPSNLEAGWHSITFTSTDASGNPFTSVSYFQVSASGTLLATSSTLASTGADTAVPFGTAAALLLVGAALMIMRRRREV